MPSQDWKISIPLSTWHFVRKPRYLCRLVPDWGMFESLLRSSCFMSIVRTIGGIEVDDLILTEDKLHTFKQELTASPNSALPFRLWFVNPDKIVDTLISRWQDLIDDPEAGWNSGGVAGSNYSAEFIVIVEDRDGVFGIHFQDVIPWSAVNDKIMFAPETIKMAPMRFEGTFSILTESQLIAQTLMNPPLP